MGTPNPSARGDASLRTELSKIKDDLAQLRRQLTRQSRKPAPAAPVVTGGGGVIGMAEVVSTFGSVVWTSGSKTFAYEGVTYDTIQDPNDGSGGGESKVPVSSWLTVNGSEITLAPGWYIPVLVMRLAWQGGGEPSAFGGPYMHGGWDIAHNDYSVHPATPNGDGMAGLFQIANHGPTYMSASTNLHAECWAVGSLPSADNYLPVSAIIWNITKLG